MAQVDLDKLTQPFPKAKVKQKRGQGGRVMNYVSHGIVTERLNEADPDWSSEILTEHIYTDGAGRLHCEGVTIKLTINGVSRVEVGGPQRQDGFVNEIKNAYSDALKRAAMRFGVALAMWESLVDSEYDEDMVESSVAQNEAHRATPPAETVRTATNAPRERREPVSRAQEHPATPVQLKRMHAMARDLGWADGDWKPTVYKDYQVAHVNELTTAQADAVIARFARKLQQLPVPMDVEVAAPGEPGNDALTR